jgi:hypothetical protein
VVALATLLHIDGRDAINSEKPLSELIAGQDDVRSPGLAYLEHLLLHGPAKP